MNRVALIFSRLWVYLAEFVFCVRVGVGLRDKWILLVETAWFHLHHNRPGRTLTARVRIGPLHPRIKMRRFGGDIFIFHEVLRCGVYDFPSRILTQEPKVIVDLGANIGLTSLTLAARFPTASLVCVEPHPENAELLRHNLQALGDRATLIEAAVAEKEGSIRLALDTEHYNASLVRSTAHTVEVNALTMESLMMQVGLSEIDLLKMDIEGAEYLILKNRPAWLQRVQVLLAEFHGAHQAEMIQWLRESGFQLEIDGSQITAWRV
jgi:FkbM family methyltransferase